MVNISGGKDSGATYLLALETLDGAFVPVFADTGNVGEATYDYVERLSGRTGGPPVLIVKADFSRELAQRKCFLESGQARRRKNKPWPERRVHEALEAGFRPTGNPFLDMSRAAGMFPSRVRSLCSAVLKRRPIFLGAIQPALEAGFLVVSWQGIRAEESLRRSLFAPWEASPDSDRVWTFRPLLAWTLADVAAIHRRHHLPLNPLYRRGFTRVGCLPCINAGKRDIRVAAAHCPAELERIRLWEREVSRVSRSGSVTFFHRSKTRDSQADIDAMVRWARTPRGKNGALPPDGPAPICVQAADLCE